MVSFASICRELHAQQCPGREFKDYCDEQLGRFSEIMKELGINIQTFRKTTSNSFELPASRKEEVKWLLQNYTTSTMKKLRKGKLRELPHDDLKEIVHNAEDIIKDKFDGKLRYQELAKMYIKTRTKIDEAINNLERTAIARIQSDVENLRTYVHQDKKIQRTLNESDRIGLINYYTQLLENTSDQFKAVTSEVDEFRRIELAEITYRMSDEKLEIQDEHLVSHLEKEMEDIEYVIWDVVTEFSKEQMSLDFPTSEELEKAEIAIAEIRKEQERK